MADTKISQLELLAETFDVDGEVFIPVVDTGDTTEAATGTTKRYSLYTLLLQGAFTGWMELQDGQYTEGSPLVLSADSDTVLTNNGAVIRNQELPIDIANDPNPDRRTFYDTENQLILGRAGDDIVISPSFYAKPTSASTTLLEVWFDITGGTGTPTRLANLYRRPISFPKGPNVERIVSFTQDGFTLDTFEENGGKIYVRANGPCDIYGFNLIIKRTHKGRGTYP